MEGKPKEIREEQLRNNSEALAAMGRKGGIHAGLLNADRKNKQEEDLKAFLAAQEQLYLLNDEGDILPPDPKDDVGATRH